MREEHLCNCKCSGWVAKRYYQNQLTRFFMRFGRPVELGLLLLLSISTMGWPRFAARGATLDVAATAAYTTSGTINILYGDGMNRDGATMYYLSINNGTRIRLSFPSPPPFAYFGKHVTVKGAAPSKADLQNGRTETAMLVSNIIAVEGSVNGDVALGTVSGTRNMIILLLKYSDDTSVPHDPSFYVDLVNPSVGNTVNAFYQADSWGLFSVHADVTPAWMLLPHPKSYYAPCGWSSVCADLTAVANDGITLGLAAGVSFTNYDMISFVLSNDLDCCAWGGSGPYTTNGVTKTYGVTWLPPWAQEVGTYSHEIGHSIGLPHSGWVYYDYDSPWDVMSEGNRYNGAACGSYFSRNSGAARTIYCYTPADTIAPYKDMLGWIDSNHLLTVTAGGSSSVTIDSLAAPLGSSRKMVKVCVLGYSCVSGGSTSRYLTLEARTHYGYDQFLPGEGVIIHMFQGDRPKVSGHCFFIADSVPLYPIDSTPGDWDSTNCSPGGRSYPNYALFNAQWQLGQSYSDPSTLGQSEISISAQSGSYSNPVTYTITISSPTFDFSLSNSNAITLPPGGSGSNTVMVTLLGDSPQSVTLSCSSGLPTGASCSFSIPSGNPPFNSTLTINTSPSTPTGSSRIAVTGTNGSLSRTTSFILIVNSGAEGAQSYFHPAKEFWFSKYDMLNAQWDAVHIVNVGTSRATIRITIGGTSINDGFTLEARNATYRTYPGHVGSPVHITSDQPIWATQRILGWTAMQEIYGMPGDAPSMNILFTWYDLAYANSDEIYIINPNTTEAASVDLYIAGVLRKGELGIAPGQAVEVSFPNIIGGPLRIFSTIPVFASQRVIGYGDFAEIIGLPSSYTSSETWFNWYDMRGAQWDAIHMLNPSTNTVNIKIYVNAALRASLSLTPGAADYRYFPGLMGGPVRVVSDQPIWVTQRIVGWGGWKEVFGSPTALANADWHMTWYDMKYAQWDAIHIINPGATDANVQIYVGSELRSDISVAAGQAAYVTYPGLIAGPVRIFSTVPIMSSQRILGWGSFEETIGATLTV